jgi:hypothetical protein
MVGQVKGSGVQRVVISYFETQEVHSCSATDACLFI